MSFLLSMYEGKYYDVGKSIGKVWEIGKHYKSTNPNKWLYQLIKTIKLIIKFFGSYYIFSKEKKDF